MTTHRIFPPPRLPDLLITLLFAGSLTLAAQSPWERAARNLEASFTGPLARSLSLVAIVLGGLMFMFGEGGAA
jgi:type IV secretory pathway VirB2 component (pilin)